MQTEVWHSDPDMLATTRRHLPVTIQRRFDVYADVAKLER